jgi:predicted YcjX-like family ATPase
MTDERTFALHQTTHVGVTGIANGGKTVFLTSLLWQLAESTNDDFHVGKRVRIDGWREFPVGKNRREDFAFQRYREALARHREWPEKTADCSRFGCEYNRSDWKMFRQRLTLFDFPGERVADAAIAAFPHYGDWSEHMLRHWSNDSEYGEAVGPFLEVTRRTEVGESELTLEYRRTLARLILGYKPLVSPSVFLLDQNGKTPESDSVEALAAERRSGLPDAEFCPLPEPLRGRFPEFAGRYQQYRRDVVLPVFRELSRCSRLVVLIDLPSLLAGGVGRYNDHRQVLLDLIDTLRPDTSIGGRLRRFLTYNPIVLDRVAFVASKLDLVHPDDIENGRVESLLRQMTARAKGQLRSVRCELFTCAACQSTRRGSRPGTLVGKTCRDNPERKEMEFTVSPVPETWPHEWSPGEYRYQHVWPQAPRNFQLPPGHFGLDRVFDYILG